MGTHRFIATKFWTDQWIQELDPSEKYMYMYLLTNHHTNISGVYEVGYKQMAHDTGYTQETIEGIIVRFSEAGKVYRMGKYIVLTNWTKHQNWEKKETIKQGIIKELEALTNEELKFLHTVGYKFPVKEIIEKRGYDIDTIPISYPYDTPTAPAIISNINLSNSKFTHEKPTEPYPAKLQEFPTANAVAPEIMPFPDHEYSVIAESPLEIINASLPETAITPVSASPPARKRKKLELTPEQMQLYHATRLCFEASEKTKAMLYQDSATTAREMNHIKTIVLRCTKIAPDISADFLKNLLEHFRIMCNGKYQGKWTFNPQCLITPWVWALVIDSLPENESPELKECIRGLFK